MLTKLIIFAVGLVILVTVAGAGCPLAGLVIGGCIMAGAFEYEPVSKGRD